MSELPEVWCAYPCHWVPSRLIIECVCVCVRVTGRKTEGQKDRQTATQTHTDTQNYEHDLRPKARETATRIMAYSNVVE